MRVIILALMALSLAGCVTDGVTGCAGFAKLTPNAGTRGYVISNDPGFARQVASHNAYGAKTRCW